MTGETGRVSRVGAGPGDEGLLTKRGGELLKKAQVLLYDRLVDPRLLCRVSEDCERIFVGKDAGNHRVSQKQINELLVKKAREGRCVVRLKGGDPFVFGRGGEEVLALEKEGIPYEVVPGVTSAVAALAAAGIPVTHRNTARSFHVITAHTAKGAAKSGSLTGADGVEDAKGRFVPYGALEGTLVFLMGVGELPTLVEQFLLGGKSKDTPAALVERGTTIRQRRINGTLETIVKRAGEYGVKPPAVFVVGEAAKFHLLSREWPLSGRRIGVTGTPAMAEKVADALKELGARVYAAPCLKIVPTKALEVRNPDYGEFSWLVFTSANGVEQFFEQLKAMGKDCRALAFCKFAVIGPGTGQALWHRGFRADYMPERYTVEALAEGTAALAGRGDRFLSLRSEKASCELTEIWERAGIACEDLGIYETAADDELADLLWRQMDVLDTLTFASASGVKAFLDAGERYRKDCREDGGRQREIFALGGPFPQRLVCIGHKTEEALKEGLPGELWNRIRTAEEYTARGLVEACLGEKGGFL